MRSGRRGGGSDLAGSRPYRSGDDVRQIDWRASARLSSARSTDEFVVREHLTEETTSVVLVVDRSPGMALFPDDLPWLRKPAAIVEAGTMIVDSALRAHCLIGYLDDADACHPDRTKRAESSFWRAPRGETESWQIKERHLPYDAFHGPPDSLARSVEALAMPDRTIAPGSFVFLLSDFLAFPREEVWRPLLLRGMELVPVVIQDPIWEQSFPDVANCVLPVTDPASTGLRLVRMRQVEADARRRENEARLAGILGRLDRLGLDPVLLSRHDVGSVLDAFLAWSEARRHGLRLAR
jgi:hypothetical protein